MAAFKAMGLNLMHQFIAVLMNNNDPKSYNLQNYEGTQCYYYGMRLPMPVRKMPEQLGVGFLTGVCASFIFVYWRSECERAQFMDGYKEGQIDYKNGKKCYKLTETPSGEVVFIYQPDTTKGRE